MVGIRKCAWVMALVAGWFGSVTGAPHPTFPEGNLFRSVYSTELAAVAALGDLTNAPTLRADDTSATIAGVSPGEMKAVYFDGLSYTGAPTRVYAYVGIPFGAGVGSPVPGVVLVHGGGGTAFQDWVTEWTNRG